MSPPSRHEAPNGEGRLHHVSMQWVEAGKPPRHKPPTGWTVLECLDDDRHMVNECLASALCDPQAKFARVPVQLLARFSALAEDLSEHLWRNLPTAMGEPIEMGTGK